VVAVRSGARLATVLGLERVGQAAQHRPVVVKDLHDGIVQADRDALPAKW